MRFAVIADIQGNLAGLQAVLGALDRREDPVDRIVCAGDVVGLGPFPNEVLDLLRERQIEIVRGNYDDAVAFDRDSSGVDFPSVESERADRLAIAWTKSALREDNLSFLRELPRDVRVFPLPSGIGVKRNDISNQPREQGRNLLTRAMFGGLYRSAPSRIKRVLIVHGSPRALNERLDADTANSILAAVAREGPADLLISAHAGTSFERELNGMAFVGVAGVSGVAIILGEAQFAVVDLGTELNVEFASVPYNPIEHVNALTAAGLPVPNSDFSDQ